MWRMALIAVAGLGMALPVTAAEILEWKPDTRVLIQPGGQYARLARLDEKTLLCVFTWKRALHLRRSTDEGKTWSEPQKITEWAPGNVANAEVLVLKNGEVIAFYNLRPAGGAKDPHSIGCCRSADGGKTWSAPISIYGGQLEPDKGCWEPAALELPDGKIAVWFANENPFPKSNDQEISVCLSSDRGLTWSKPRRFSYRENARDGMPVSVLSADGKSVHVAIEDNGLSGTFKPVILTAPVSGIGGGGFINADSSRRQGALAEPLPPQAYAGAPYLRMMPGNGRAPGKRIARSVLSFQLAPGGDMKQSAMAVCLGNSQAEKFGLPSFPFPRAPEGPAQLWNALFIKNEKIVTAITETSLEGKQGIWSIDGEVKTAP